MDRRSWLAERRAAVVAQYDAEATSYEDDGYPNETQREWVARLLRACPPGSLVLDAPCGTGQYFAMVAAAGHRVVGVEQSAGMLQRARARHIAIAAAQVGLQELSYAGQFNAAMTIDAMENVCPEDWPLVLVNLRTAMQPDGVLYLTVEEVAPAEIEEAFDQLTRQGIPAVRGEIVEGDVAGYHYYPGRDLVLDWFQSAGLDVLDEGFKQEDGWGYRHFLLRKSSS